MITVTINTSGNWLDNFLKRREIRDWCRNAIGKNPARGQRLWRTVRSSTQQQNVTVYSIQVSFATAEDATLFLLRWS